MFKKKKRINLVKQKKKERKKFLSPPRIKLELSAVKETDVAQPS